MKRSVLAVASAAVLSLGVFSGVASAQDVNPPRLCSVVNQELADLQADLTFPLNVGGANLPNLGAVQSLLSTLPANAQNNPLRAELQAVLDAAARLELLKQESTTCLTPAPPTSTTPAPEPTETPAPTTVVPEPVLFENCDEARAAGAAPILAGNAGYRLELDADGDGVACEDVEGPASTVVESPSVTVSPDVTVNNNVDGDVATSIPQGGIETGAF